MQKRYYWLKLKNDFFRTRKIKMIAKTPKGGEYILIYLKMLLLSLETDGVLTREFLTESFAEELALDIDASPEDIAETIKILTKYGLIEVDETSYRLTQIPEMTGSETSSAKRSRKYRRKKKQKEDEEEAF